MLELIRDALSNLRRAADLMDESLLPGDQAVALVELLTDVERVTHAARMTAARRVEESKVWQRDGHRTAAQWIASKTGSTVGQAIVVLEAARDLEDAPLTRRALRDGLVSETQAREVASAAAADPKSERALLESARWQPVHVLREECRRVRAAAVPDELAAHERIFRGRYFKSWTDSDGAVRFAARLTPDAGARVNAAIDRRRARIFQEARREGRRESSDAFAADALVELAVADRGPRSGPGAMIHVLVDYDVLASGRAGKEQTCEIPGVGRIPAATAGAIAADAVLKAIVAKGDDIHQVVHVGRTIPARLRTALEVRDQVCVVPGCGRRQNLQIDHYRRSYAAGGLTKLDNLARICAWHHHQKTHLGYRLGGGPGAWTWETPDQLENSRPPPHPSR